MKDYIIVHDSNNKPMLFNITKISAIYYDDDEESYAIDIEHSTFYIKETVTEIENKIKYGM